MNKVKGTKYLFVAYLASEAVKEEEEEKQHHPSPLRAGLLAVDVEIESQLVG